MTDTLRCDVMTCNNDANVTICEGEGEDYISLNMCTNCAEKYK